MSVAITPPVVAVVAGVLVIGLVRLIVLMAVAATFCLVVVMLDDAVMKMAMMIATLMVRMLMTLRGDSCFPKRDCHPLLSQLLQAPVFRQKS